MSSPVRQTPTGHRRLVQDFVRAPIPFTAILAHLAARPSPVPGLVADAAEAAGVADPAGAERQEVRPTVQLLGERPRPGGWSIQLGWPDATVGFPGFEGELVMHELATDQTWLGIEGAVSLAISGELSDRDLREAQLRLREMLDNLAALLRLACDLPNRRVSVPDPDGDAV